jgi:hypothetical protein
MSQYEKIESNKSNENLSHADMQGDKSYNANIEKVPDKDVPLTDTKTDLGVSDATINQEEPEKNDPEKTDILEVFIEQTNISGTADTQENNVGLYLKEQSFKELSVIVSNHNSISIQNIVFNEFQYMHYRDQCQDQSALAYIDNMIELQYEKFQETGVVVINNNLFLNELSMITTECILARGNSFSNANLYNCDLHNIDVSISQIVSFYKKHNKLKSEKSVTLPGIIILYCNKNFYVGINELLRPILTKGGLADSIAQSLKIEKIQIICLCNDRELYKTHVREGANFAIINISDIHLSASRAISDKHFFFGLMPIIEKAVSGYDWLSKLTAQEQEEKIHNLINAGRIEQELNEMINGIDLEESKVLTDLAANPLNNIAIFIAAFFEGISVLEFDTITRALALKFLQGKKSDTSSAKLDEPLVAWEICADSILAQCGIKAESISEDLLTFKFESESRKRNAVKVLLNNYTLYLVRSIHVIEELLLNGKENSSIIFLQKFTELIFIAPKGIQETILSSICLNITDQLNKASLDDKQLKQLFKKLLFLVNRWSEKEEVHHSLNIFYQRMIETPPRRSILGALLTHNCTPDKPKMMVVLKLLLNSVCGDEYFIKFKLPRIVVLNYVNKISSLQSTINDWATAATQKKLSKAFSFFKSSLFVLFYENRFSPALENNFEYQLIRSVLKDVNEQSYTLFLTFIFSNRDIEIFNYIFERDENDTPQDKKLLAQLNTESLYNTYAFIFIRCQYLAIEIEGNSDNSSKSISERLTEALTLIRHFVSMPLLGSALSKAVRKYNTLIRIENEQMDSQQTGLKAVYKAKRDGARELITLTERIQ